MKKILLIGDSIRQGYDYYIKMAFEKSAEVYYPGDNCRFTGYIVWQNNNSLMNENTTLAEYMADCDICVAKFNGEGFDAPIRITDNDVMDSRPTVCTKDDSIEIVWVTNTENDILGISGKNTIKHLTLGGTICDVVSGINAVTELAIGYMGDELNIAYSYDEDNNLSSINDRDIYICRNGVITALNDDEFINSNPIFSGNNLYWYEGGNIYYTDNLIDKYSIFESFDIGTDMFYIDTNDNGDASVWWVNPEEHSSEVYTAVCYESKWSEAIKLTDLGGDVKSPYGILTDSGEMLVGFNSYNFVDDEMSANLCTVKVIPAYDIALYNPQFNETNLILGEKFPITVNVKNSGEKEIDGFKILVSQNNTVINEYEFTDTLKAGTNSDIEINYSVPERMTKSEIEISVQIVEEEYKTDNNTVKVTLGNTNPVIDELKVYEIEDEVKISTSIINKGFDNSDNITINLREDSEDGDILKTELISDIASGGNTQVDFSVNVYSLKYHDGVKQLYVTLETEEDVVYSDYIVLEERAKEEGYEQLIPLISYDEEEKILNINAIVKNTTQENKDFMMVFCVYDGERLVGCYTKEGTVRKCNETAVDGFVNLNVFDENYTVATLLISDFNNMIPLCSKAIYGKYSQ